MIGIAEAKVGHEVLKFVKEILEYACEIARIMKGVAENQQTASRLLDRVKAIEPALREVNEENSKKMSSLSESLRQLRNTVKEIHGALEKYEEKHALVKALKQHAIAAKFDRLRVKLDQDLITLGAVAGIARLTQIQSHSPVPVATVEARPVAVSSSSVSSSAASSSAGVFSLTVPGRTMEDVLKGAERVVTTTTVGGAAAGAVGGGALGALGALGTTVGLVGGAAIGTAAAAAVGAAAGVGYVVAQVWNVEEKNDKK